jgi:phenylacetate-CoA ligase
VSPNYLLLPSGVWFKHVRVELSQAEVNKQKHFTAQKLLSEMMERIDWPAARIRSFREAALRSLIARLKIQSTWHAKRLAHLDPACVSERDLHSIPAMTKTDLMANFDEIVTDRRLSFSRCQDFLKIQVEEGGYLDDRYQVSVSGGSGGMPALTVFSWQEAARQWATFARFLYRWGNRTGNLKGSPKVATITTPNPVFRAQHVVNFFESASSNLFPVTAPTDEMVSGLNRARPDILMVYPSIIPRLASEAEAGRLRISPMLVITAAEPLLTEHETALSRVWTCPVINGWGATEVGGLAMGSGFEPGMLLMDDEVIVETVDRNGNPVVTGERAEKVFITPLFRSTLPLLRYQMTDQLAILPGAPRCGSGFRLISNVECRLEDYFKYDGGIEISPDLFSTVLGQELEVLEYQVHQTKKGAHILVTSNRAINSYRLSRAVSSKMHPFMDAEPVVTVRQVPRIERTGEAAKLKRFIPLKHANG